MKDEDEKLCRLLEMIEHPEKYTDEELRTMLADDDVREFYELISEVDGALTPRREPDVEQALKRTERSHRQSRWRRHIAVVAVGIPMFLGLAIAAIVTHIYQSHQQELKSAQRVTVQALPASGRHVAAQPVLGADDEKAKPYWKFTNSASLMLRQVVRSDTATLLTFHILRRVSWKLCDEAQLQADGQSYRLKWKQELHGCDSLVACFEPLPRAVSSFDFIESNDFGAWRIYGIRLGKPYAAAPVSSSQKGKLQTLPEEAGWEQLQAFVPRHDTAVVRGHIIGYEERYKSFTYIVYMDPITGRQANRCTLDSLGNFEYKVDLDAPFTAYLEMVGIPFNPLMVPGDTTEIEIDLQRYINAQITPRPHPTSSEREGITLRGRFAPYEAVIRTRWFANGVDIEPGYTTDSLRNDSALSFADYADKVWLTYQRRLRAMEQRRDLTTRQRDFSRLYWQNRYVTDYLNYPDYVWLVYVAGMESGDSVARTKQREARGRIVYEDRHAQQMNYLNTMLAPYFSSDKRLLPYLQVNGFTSSPYYHWLNELHTKINK